MDKWRLGPIASAADRVPPVTAVGLAVTLKSVIVTGIVMHIGAAVAQPVGFGPVANVPDATHYLAMCCKFAARYAEFCGCGLRR